MLRFTVSLLGATLLTCACGQGASREPLNASQTTEAWNEANDPANLRDAYDVRFSSLPLTGELEVKPWTDTYWPNYRAGLADRWNDPSRPDPFTYPLNDAAAVATMDDATLRQLSPAEKYDLLLGRYDYPLVSYERERTNPDDPSWFGLCHGWAPAALNFKEPKPVTLTSQAGLQVPFGSSDIKALLLFAQQYGTTSRSVGQRCNANTGDGNECKDINAGSFHVILSNQIALLKAGFVAEVERTSQIWNQPVYGYTTSVVGESTDIYANAAPGTVKIVQVMTQLRYIAELSPQWEPLTFADFPGQQGHKSYEYTLELNAADEIIGGEWRSSDHPDFFWIQTAPGLTGFFSELKRLYEAAAI